MKYIDIHSHLQWDEYEHDRATILHQMEEHDVYTIVVGTDLLSSQKAVALAETYSHVYACIGVHPTSSERFTQNKHVFAKLAQHPKVVAIGECGLDYAQDVDAEQQKIECKEQIQWAVSCDKPLMIHCRDAHQDMISLLKEQKEMHKEKVRGNIHFFSGTPEQADAYLSLGFTVSFTGVITFASSYDSVIKHIPLHMIMAETDAPFVAPIPYRGKRNDPLKVIEVVKKIAEIRKESVEVIQKAVVENAKRVFRV